MFNPGAGERGPDEAKGQLVKLSRCGLESYFWHIMVVMYWPVGFWCCFYFLESHCFIRILMMIIHISLSVLRIP